MKRNTLQNRLLESLITFKDNTAIQYGSKTITYAALDERSDYIANWLINKGIEKETLIGILIHDRIRFICTLIGILKARCVFVPLDSTHPKNRLEVMINSIGTPLVFIDDINLTRFEFEDSAAMGEPQVKFIQIEDLLSDDNPLCSSRKKDVQYSPGDKIYIYFTSGTTGTPKAFVGKNKSLLHFVDWEIAALGLDQTLRCSQFTTPGFDAFLRDVFVPLCCGGSICIPRDEEIMLESGKLAAWLETSDIALVHCVPSLFRLLSAAKLTPHHFSNLKFILLSGERINPPDLIKWYETFDERIQLVNLWGTSETTLAKTAYFIRKSDIQRERIPVGKPIPGARVIIMDRAMNVCKQQMVGILYIRTPYRTFGYYDDPGLNRKRFIQNPFNPDPDDLLHCTGDLGRLLPDGNLELLGRDDRQVKIRGIRIELEEIESVLRKHPGVEEAVVIKKVTSGAGELLCSYITYREEEPGQNLPGQSKALSIHDRLRDYLSGELPGYMVPAVFQVLEKIPRNPNGKVDYEALPEPLPEQEKECILPRHRVEEKLLKCWTEVLGIDRIGINSNFFQLGGNSLNIMSLISKIHKEFDVRIPLGDIFNHPTIEQQAEIIKGAKADKYTSLELVEEKEYYALSSAQKRMYFLYRMEPDTSVYNMPSTIVLEGAVDRERLEETFVKLVKRHETFRTSFEMLEGLPIQRIHREVPFEIDYFEVDKEEAQQMVERYLRPFDLSQAPILRVGLIKIAEARHILIVEIHHIISDGTSEVLFVKDFIALFRGESLPLLRVRYRDFSEWRNSREVRKAVKHQETFWLKEFEDNIPVLNLPLDYPRPLVQVFDGAFAHSFFDAQESENLKTLALKKDATLFMVLLAIFNVLLSKISSQEDIVVGTGTEGRRHEDLQQIIGMFINTLALRNYPHKEKTFSEFLKEVKSKTLDAFENQGYQFEDLVEEVAVNRDTGRNPLFDVSFQMETIERAAPAQAAGINIKPHEYERKISRFDLTLWALETPDLIYFYIEYCTRLFKEETIILLLKYFKVITASLMAAAGKKLSDIEIISKQEKQNLLFHLNEELDNEVKIIDNKQYKTIQDKLNTTLHLFKNHIAISYGERYLTYSELDKRSNYIARGIIHRGITKQAFIGIMMDDRMELTAAVIGILKAGCVFVPLDTDHPGSRLEMMCRFTNVKYVMSNNAAFSQMWEPGFMESHGHGPEFIFMEELFRSIKNPHNRPTWDTVSSLQADTNPKPAVQYGSEDQIYIYFTSGTTGTPRAMVGRNRSLLHFIDWEIETLGIKQGCRVSQLTTPGFDAFLRDVFVPLCSGGVICIPGNKDILLDSGALINWIRDSVLHLIHCVPSLFRLFNSHHLSADDFKELKFILLSGESIAISDLMPWYETFADRIQLVNLWGTSETTLAKTCYFIKKDDISRERIPVGLPIEGARVVILDKGMNICPPLVIGEIYIITSFSTHGYCQDPELSNERFLPNPFSTNPRDRMHKTGDLGRLLPDGNLDVLGRIDRQVKVRGIRVELEEIENLLMRHTRIKEAVVIKEETANTNELLYAYVVGSPGTGAENEEEVELLEELEEYLTGKLPAYMLPAGITKIERIPRTSRGKVDYDSLPEPLTQRRSGYAAPRDVIETKLLEIWTEILGIEKPSITSQFFKLGGNSLNIMSLISKIHKEFDVRIPLGKIFNNATIEKQAKIIKKEKEDKYISIEPLEKKEYYSLSSAQKRLYILYRMDKESISYNMPTVVELEGELEKELMEKSFRQLITRHESFRTSFKMVKEVPVQKLHDNVGFEIEYYDLATENTEGTRGLAPLPKEPAAPLRNSQPAAVLINYFIRPFDLSRAPLLRVGIIKIEQRRYVLKIDVHHIVSDGTSAGILIKDFMAFYGGEELQGLRIQYKDFSEWQNKLIESGGMSKQEKYWLKQFEGRIPVLNLPLDYPRPSIPNFEGNGVYFELDKALTREINDLVSETGTTLHMILLAAYNVLLSKYCAQEDIVVGFGIAGRTHADLENVAGMFVNMLGVRNRTRPDQSFIEFVMEVKENVIRAYENQDYQFEELTRKLGIQRKAGRNPLFDAVFNFQNMKISRAELPHLHIKPFNFEYKVTQFDLTLMAFQSNGTIVMTLDYLAALFKPSTVQKMTKHYVEIMKQLVVNKNIKLKDISLSHDLSTGRSKLNQEDVIEFEFCL